MAEAALGDVRVPTLFIVSGADTDVLQRNRDAFDRLDCERSLHVIEGAGHLFEEDHELREVVTVAADWFEVSLA